MPHMPQTGIADLDRSAFLTLLVLTLGAVAALGVVWERR